MALAPSPFNPIQQNLNALRIAAANAAGGSQVIAVAIKAMEDAVELSLAEHSVIVDKAIRESGALIAGIVDKQLADVVEQLKRIADSSEDDDDDDDNGDDDGQGGENGDPDDGGGDHDGEDTADDDTTDDGTTGDDTTGDDTNGDDTTDDGTTGDDTTGDDTNGDDTTDDGTTGDDTTGDDTTGDGTAGDDTNGDDTAGDGTPGDSDDGEVVSDEVVAFLMSGVEPDGTIGMGHWLGALLNAGGIASMGDIARTRGGRRKFAAEALKKIAANARGDRNLKRVTKAKLAQVRKAARLFKKSK